MQAEQGVALRRDIGTRWISASVVARLGITQEAGVGNHRPKPRSASPTKTAEAGGQRPAAGSTEARCQSAAIAAHRRAQDAVFVARIGDVLQHKAQIEQHAPAAAAAPSQGSPTVVARATPAGL